MVKENNMKKNAQKTQQISRGLRGGNGMKKNHQHYVKDRNRHFLPSRLLYAQQIGSNNERPNVRQESDRILDLMQNRLI